jgi:hypothetical protein
MQTFTDARNRTWQLSIDCDTVEQIQEKLGINVLDLMDRESGLLSELSNFPPLVCKILTVAIAEQLAAAKVSDADFRKAMNGDTLSDAAEALLAEIVNFSPKSRRPLLQAVLAKSREVQEAGTKLALDRLQDPALSSQLLAVLEERIAAEMREAVEGLGERESSASGSWSGAGTPPDCSASPGPDLIPFVS